MNRTNRRSIRLKDYDYSQAGYYFVTICTQKHVCLFGDVLDGQMVLNEVGQYVQGCWQEIPNHFPHVKLDNYCIMPNHIHGIIIIVGPVDDNEIHVGAKNFSPLRRSIPECTSKSFSRQHSMPLGPSKTIGSIVRGFKIGVTKWMRQHHPGQILWQRNYYEHIIRDERDYNRICKYIETIPLKCEQDSLNPVFGE